MKILVVEPMKPCEVREIPDTLEAMQALVGGHIQAVYPFRDDVALVCNEEGRNLGLPYNRPLTNDRGVPYEMICGTFFLAGVGPEDFISLTDDQIQRYKALYDNVMVVTAERPAVQAEIAPEAAMLDFAVACQLTFRFARDGQEAAESKDAFISHITEVLTRTHLWRSGQSGGWILTSGMVVPKFVIRLPVRRKTRQAPRYSRNSVCGMCRTGWRDLAAK